MDCLVEVSPGTFKLRSFLNANEPIKLSDLSNQKKVYDDAADEDVQTFYITCYNYAPVDINLGLSDLSNALKHYSNMWPAPQHLLEREAGYASL